MSCSGTLVAPGAILLCAVVCVYGVVDGRVTVDAISWPWWSIIGSAGAASGLDSPNVQRRITSEEERTMMARREGVKIGMVAVGQGCCDQPSPNLRTRTRPLGLLW